MHLSSVARCAALLLCFVLPACSQAPSIGEAPAGEFAAEGLHPVRNSGFQSAYVLPGADLPSYRVIGIAPLELETLQINATPMTGTLRRDWELTPERAGALAATWDAAMRRAFRDYQLGASGESALRIEAALVSIGRGRPSATTIGGAIQPVGSSEDVVEITGEFRLYDSAEGTLLAVIRDSRTITSVAMSRTVGPSMQRLFGSWAALLHTRVSGR